MYYSDTLEESALPGGAHGGPGHVGSWLWFHVAGILSAYQLGAKAKPQRTERELGQLLCLEQRLERRFSNAFEMLLKVLEGVLLAEAVSTSTSRRWTSFAPFLALALWTTRTSPLAAPNPSAMNVTS